MVVVFEEHGMSFQLDPEIIARLRKASRVAVLTGSGVSAEAGVPTVREFHTGKWAEFDTTELATPQAFVRNPGLVWEWYDYRRRDIEARTPSDSHYALVDMEQYYPDFTLITQSIDGLHWRAGSRDLIELHGNIHRVRCFECSAYAQSWDEEGVLPPLCVRCGGMLRPDVVWLGEGLPSHELRRAYEVAQRAEVFFAIGTSARVRPAASLPLIAKRAGAFVIEINPDETALSLMADYWMSCKASDVLSALAQKLTDELEEREEGL
jgi:NAD-dependent deacetylase